MTHTAVLTTGLTVDGTDWTAADLGIVARVTSGLNDGLEVRGTDYTVPGTGGQVPFGRLAHQRLIRAEGMIMGSGTSWSDQLASYQALEATIGGTMRGDQDPYTLEVTLQDGSVWTISARPLRVEWGPDSLPTYREFIAYWVAVGDPTADPPVPPDWVLQDPQSLAPGAAAVGLAGATAVVAVT